MAELVNTVQAINLIALNPAIRGGRAYLLGTTITVADVIIARHYHHLDADGIADWYGLTLAQVYAALSYYYEHKPEIDQQIRGQIRQAEQLRESQVGSRTALLSG